MIVFLKRDRQKSLSLARREYQQLMAAASATPSERLGVVPADDASDLTCGDGGDGDDEIMSGSGNLCDDDDDESVYAIPLGRVVCDARGKILAINRDIAMILYGTPALDPDVDPDIELDQERISACQSLLVGENIDWFMPEVMRDMHRKLIATYVQNRRGCKTEESPLGDPLNAHFPEIRWSSSFRACRHAGSLLPCDTPASPISSAPSSVRESSKVRASSVWDNKHIRCVSRATHLLDPTCQREELLARLAESREIMIDRPWDKKAIGVRMLVVRHPSSDTSRYTVFMTPSAESMSPSMLARNTIPRPVVQILEERAVRSTWLDRSVTQTFQFETWTPIMFMDICRSTEFAAKHSDEESREMHHKILGVVERTYMPYSHQIRLHEIIGDCAVFISRSAADPVGAPAMKGPEVCTHTDADRELMGIDACTVDTCEMLWRRMRRSMEVRVMARLGIHLLDAVRAIVGPETDLPDTNIRIGINCGTVANSVFLRSSALNTYGISVPATARIEGDAKEGTILVSRAVIDRLIDDMGGNSLHDRAVVLNKRMFTVCPATSSMPSTDSANAFMNRSYSTTSLMAGRAIVGDRRTIQPKGVDVGMDVATICSPSTDGAGSMDSIPSPLPPSSLSNSRNKANRLFPFALNRNPSRRRPASCPSSPPDFSSSGSSGDDDVIAPTSLLSPPATTTTRSRARCMVRQLSVGSIMRRNLSPDVRDNVVLAESLQSRRGRRRVSSTATPPATESEHVLVSETLAKFEKPRIDIPCPGSPPTRGGSNESLLSQILTARKPTAPPFLSDINTDVDFPLV